MSEFIQNGPKKHLVNLRITVLFGAARKASVTQITTLNPTWIRTSKESFQHLVESMPGRAEAVLGTTQY